MKLKKILKEQPDIGSQTDQDINIESVADTIADNAWDIMSDMYDYIDAHYDPGQQYEEPGFNHFKHDDVTEKFKKLIIECLKKKFK